jgi:general secretion pathway protein K
MKILDFGFWILDFSTPARIAVRPPATARPARLPALPAGGALPAGSTAGGSPHLRVPPSPRPSVPSASSSTGAALLLVLWAVLILSVAVLTAARIVELDLDSAGRANRRFEARLLALSGLALAMNEKIKRGSPLLRQNTAPNAGFTAEILSEGSRANINRLLESNDTRTLRELFRYWNVDDRAAAAAIDSLKDWVDGDDLRSLNGAEARDIPPDSGWSIPQNRSFLSIKEMAAVRGMEAVVAVKPDWADYFSVFSGEKMDLQDAPEDLLVVFGGLAPAQARTLIKLRNGQDGLPGTLDDIEIDSTGSLRAIFPMSDTQFSRLEQYFSVGESPVRITSRGRMEGVEAAITAVVDARGQPLDGSLLMWEE